MARYALRGNIAARLLASAPTLAAPTQAQLVAGTNLIGAAANSENLADLSGWEPSDSVIDTPDAFSLVTGNIPGESKYGQAEMMFYRDSTVSTIFDAAVAAINADRWVALCPRGLGVGKPSTIFPVKIINCVPIPKIANEAAKFRVTFAVGVPTEGVQAA